MNEGGMIKMYVDRNNINETDVASAAGIAPEKLKDLYESQTVAPDIKQKLQGYFKRNIFDGSLLMEDYKDVPDNQANKAKD